MEAPPPPQATDVDAVSLDRLSAHLDRLLDPAFFDCGDAEIVLAAGGNDGTGGAIVAVHRCILADDDCAHEVCRPAIDFVVESTYAASGFQISELVSLLQEMLKHLPESMGRGKIELKKIENPTNRQVTFSKRRMGLLKKANELSILCDAQIGVIIFSGNDKMYEYSSPPWRIANIFDRYLKAPSTRFDEMDIQQKIVREMTRMKDERSRLRMIMSQYMGENLGLLSLQDVTNLEQQLESSLYKVRLRKQELLDQQLLEMRHRQTQSAEMVAHPNKPFPWWDVGSSSGHQLYDHDAEPAMTALQLLPQLGEYKLLPQQPNLQGSPSLPNYVLRL